MRTLDLDWADLELAFRDGTGSESFIDTASGEIVTLMAGFPDEADLRDKLRRFPGRFLKVPPLESGFTREVIHAFIARQPKGALKKQLEEAEAGPGGVARTMALLREDKGNFASFSRFEQMELVRRVEEFLGRHGLRAGTEPPAPELFEGIGS